MPKSELNALTLLAVFIAGPIAGRFSPAEPWTPLLAGVALLVILFAFDRETDRSIWQSVAFAATCGFCVSIALPPAFSNTSASSHRTDLVGDSALAHNAAPQPQPSPWAPADLGRATILFCIIDRSRMTPGAPATNTSYQPSPSPVLMRQAAPAYPAYQPPPQPRFEPVLAPPPPPPPFLLLKPPQRLSSPPPEPTRLHLHHLRHRPLNPSTTHHRRLLRPPQSPSRTTPRRRPLLHRRHPTPSPFRLAWVNPPSSI